MKQKEDKLRAETEEMIRMDEDKRLMDEKQRNKRLKVLKNSSNWKKTIHDMVPTNRREISCQANAYYWTKAYAEKKAESFGLLDPDMTEELKNVKPWVEV